MEDIRDILRGYISDNGYKQSAIARKCNTHPVTFNQILTKKMRLTADMLFTVCDVLGITPDQLRSYKGEATCDKSES